MTSASLQNQFNTLLTQYTETYQNYIQAIQSGDTTFTSVPNTSFLGQKNIQILQNSSADSCQSACSTSTTTPCSGANFNTGTTSCTLLSGPGNIVPNVSTTAIVREALYYSYQLQQLNDQLTQINNQIKQSALQNMGKYQTTQQQQQQQEEILQTNYQILEQERKQIDAMIQEFETVHSAYENGTLSVDSYYNYYWVLLVIVVVLVGILAKITLSN
jgi:hypothetical protein